jgi:hypothetical protein
MTKLKDAEIRNLRKRVRKLTEEAKEWQQRAEEAEMYLELADAQLAFIGKVLPAQVKWNYWVH